MKRALAAIAAAVALVAPVTATALTGPAATAASKVPECGNGDLTASYKVTDAGAGHAYGQLRLTNTGDRTCFTRGYGGLSYVGHGDGTQIGAAADRTPSKVRRIVLQPGDRAVSRVEEANAQNYPKRRCHPRDVDGFRVYLPDATRSQFVAHETTGCARVQVHLLAHKAYRLLG
jgi:hypothetical protein